MPAPEYAACGAPANSYPDLPPVPAGRARPGCSRSLGDLVRHRDRPVRTAPAPVAPANKPAALRERIGA